MQASGIPRFSTIQRQALLSGLLLLATAGGLLLVGALGFDALSSARAYVGGEGLWSKAQKDAVHHLTRYVYTRDSVEYRQFEQYLQVPLGDQIARRELQQERPDWDRVRAGFLQGRNHPDDIAGMGRFFRRFHRVPFVAAAIGYWTQGDSLITELLALGATVHDEIDSPHPDERRISASLQQVDRLTHQLALVEDSFSGAMGAGARRAKTVLEALLAAAAASLLVLAGLGLQRASRLAEAAEASRHASEEQFRAMVHHAQIGIVRTTRTGAVLSANPALVRMLGYADEADLMQLDVSRDLHQVPEERERLLRELEDRGQTSFESTLRRKDGRVIQVHSHVRLVSAKGGAEDSIEAFVEDVTQQRSLEEQLRQAQKMEAVGQLTGGIAHDFNNLLTVILSTATLIEQQLPADLVEARDDLEDLTSAVRRGGDMVRKLMAFSRDRRLQFHAQPLSPLVEAAAELLPRVLPANIEVAVHADPTAATVRTDAGSIEQILLNLATNARDAMPEGGRLEITVRSLSESAGGPPTEVFLQVSDTGMGMDAATKERLFEPFFTTKPPGLGSGLGLTMVHGLMQQHGGRIAVESSPGRGTQIRLYFPVADATLPTSADRPERPEQGKGTILLVEDEESLRRATARLLEHSGYRVIAAGDGQEALDIWERRRAEIDLILTDIVMPRLSGTQLYAELRKRGLGIPVVLTSGYTTQDGGGPASLPEGVPFLAKPWELATLLLTLHHARNEGAMPPAGAEES